MGLIDFSDYIQDRTLDFTGREWVFHAVETWLVDPTGSRVFLLTGGPGSGKTAVTARLVQMSLGQIPTAGYPPLATGYLAFHHFCQAQHDATLNPLRFVEAFSLALAARYQLFAQALVELQQGDKQITINATQTVTTAADGSQVHNVVIQNLNVGNVSARVAFDQTVRKPLEVLCTPEFKEKLVILVDSLDEARTWREEENILSLLAETLDDPRDLPTAVRFILTCRSDERILQTIGHAPTIDLIADAPPDAQEVNRYATIRLAKVQLDKTLLDGLADRLAVASAGNFLYARYVLDDWLAHPAEITFDSALDLPAGLSDIYGKFLKRELARDEEKWEDRYQLLLSLLAVARGEGLSLTTLAGATGKQAREVGNALRACAQYLAGQPPEGPFRIYHQSFRDFLLEETNYPVYPAEAHQALAQYFLAENIDGDWIKNEDRYALQYVVYHLVEAMKGAVGSKVRQELHTQLCGLLTDFGFLEAKVCALSAFELLNDLRMGLNNLTQDDPQVSLVRMLEKILLFDSHYINRHPTVLFQCCWNRGWWHDSSQAANFFEPPSGMEMPAITPWSQPGLKMHAYMERWRAWRTQSGRVEPWLRFLRPPPDPLSSPQIVLLITDDDSPYLAVSADGQKLVSGGSYGTIRLWDLTAGNVQIAELMLGDEYYVGCISFTPDQDSILVGLGDGSVRFLDPSRLNELGRLQVSNEAITAAVFLEGGKLLLVGDSVGNLSAWDIEQGTHITYTNAYDEITSLTLHSDGSTFAVGAGGWKENAVGLWRYSDGSLIQIKTYPIQKSYGVGTVLFSPDGKLLAWAEDDDRLTICEMQSGKVIHQLQLARPADRLPGSLAFLPGMPGMPDGRYLLHGSGDVNGIAVITCWDLHIGAVIWQLEGHTGGINAMVVYDGGRRLASAGVNNDNTIRLWDLEQAASGLIWTQAETAVTQVLFSSDGELVCACSESGDTVHIRALDDGKIVHRLGDHSGGVMSATLSPDGQFLACRTGQEQIKIWDIIQGKAQSGFPSRKSIGDIAFSKNGRLLGSVASGSRIDLVDMASKTLAAQLKAKGESYISCFGFSRDDQLVAAVGSDALWVWSTDSGELHTRLDGSDICYSICFTEDKEQLVLEGPLEGLMARSLATGAAIEIEDHHHRAFALDKGRDPHGWKWYLPDPIPKEGQVSSELEMTLLTPQGTPIAWLPFRFGHVYHHPSGRIWAVLREGQFFLLTIEDADI